MACSVYDAAKRVITGSEDADDETHKLTDWHTQMHQLIAVCTTQPSVITGSKNADDETSTTD